MPSIRNSYLFGRINLYASDETIKNKFDFFVSSLNTKVVVTKYKFSYGFFDVIVVDQHQQFLSGNLVKWRSELENEVVDQKKHIISEARLPDAVVGKSDFYIHVPSGIIAYHPISNKISDQQFRDIFTELIINANERFFVGIKFEVINEQIRLIDAINKLDKIFTVSFSVHPTNPSNRDVFKDIDERIKRLNAGEYSSTIEAKSTEGLNRQALQDDEFLSGIYMAADGYGDAMVSGIKGGREITIYTKNSPIKKSIEKSEDRITILNRLREMFERIQNRGK